MKGITERQPIEIENMTADQFDALKAYGIKMFKGGTVVGAILGCLGCLTIGILVYESISAHKEKQEEGS